VLRGARPGGSGAMRGRDGEGEVSDERMGGRAVDVSVYAPILVKSDMAVDRARDERRVEGGPRPSRRRSPARTDEPELAATRPQADPSALAPSSSLEAAYRTRRVERREAVDCRSSASRRPERSSSSESSSTSSPARSTTRSRDPAALARPPCRPGDAWAVRDPLEGLDEAGLARARRGVLGSCWTGRMATWRRSDGRRLARLPARAGVR